MPTYKFATFSGSIREVLCAGARKNVHLQFMLVHKNPGVFSQAGGTLFKCRIADKTGEMGAIFYDEVGLALKVGDVVQLKEGMHAFAPPSSTCTRCFSRHLGNCNLQAGYTMLYTSMGETDLFLYKGKDGFIQKIDEINMEVSHVTRCIARVSSLPLHTPPPAAPRQCYFRLSIDQSVHWHGRTPLRI